jgi:hypothetical protein
MRRRDFIMLIGGATAAWPLAVRAQQPAIPIIGYLSSGTEAGFAPLVAAFRRGLNEAGLSKDPTSRSNSAGPRVKTSDCRHLSPISFAAKSR